MMAAFLFIAHEKGFKFQAQPQTDAYSCLLYGCTYASRNGQKNRHTYFGIFWSDLSGSGLGHDVSAFEERVQGVFEPLSFITVRT